MVKSNRDNFSKKTIDAAAKRCAYRCSYCSKPTIGPSFENNEAISSTGVAAHICAAAPGGKRYDPNMTSKQRKSIDNCIWMCQTHARLIDTDDTTYTVDVLKEMKVKAEQAAAEANADINFFKKYFESKSEDTTILSSLFDQMIIEGNYDLLRSTLECYSSTISPIFDEIVYRYHIIYDMYCSRDLLQSHIEHYLSLPQKIGANQLIELFISFNFIFGTTQLLDYCSDEELKSLANLLINGQLEEKVICSSINDDPFEWPKGKEKLLYKYVLCVVAEKEIINLVNEKGENISFNFDEQYFKLFHSAYSLNRKMLRNDISFDTNPDDIDYNYLAQRIKIIRQLNFDAQLFIWETLLHFLFLTPAKFNSLSCDIPIFIKEETKIETSLWLFKIEHNIGTINIDDLLEFSKKHCRYYVLARYLSMIDVKFRKEFIADHMYLLKEDSHFIYLYANDSNPNITLDDLLKYKNYYPNDFLYHCICYDYADQANKIYYFNWIVDNRKKLSIENIPHYLEIISKEQRYDLLLEMNQKIISNNARLFIANQLASSRDPDNSREAQKIYERLLNEEYHAQTLHFNYAVLQSKSGKFEDVKKHFQMEYDLHKDLNSLYGLLHSRYETNSVLDDVYLTTAKSITTAEFQYIVAASYFKLQNTSEAKNHYLRTLLLDEDSKCVGMLSSLTLDDNYIDVTDIGVETVCILESEHGTINVAIHDAKLMEGIRPNNFANCIHLSCNNPLISSLIYAKVADTVQFDSKAYVVKEIIPLWKYLSGFSFSKIASDKKTITIKTENGKDFLTKIQGIMLDNRKRLYDTLEECNNQKISLPLSAFAHRLGKRLIETCEFLATGNTKKISNNISFVPHNTDMVYILSFDAIVLLAISGMLPKISSLPNVICPIQVKNSINIETSELLNDLNSKSSKGNLILVDGSPRLSQHTDEFKRNRYRYLVELNTSANSISALDAYDFKSDKDIFDGLFSNSLTLIESGALGLAQNTKNSILVTDNQFLYAIADTVELKNTGLCNLIIQLSDSFTDLLDAVKKLHNLNFNNYFPLFVFKKMLHYLSEETNPQIKLENTKKLNMWLLSESEEQDASDHHADVIIQLFKDYLAQENSDMDIKNSLERIAIHHFKKHYPDIVAKALSDFWKKLKKQ